MILFLMMVADVSLWSRSRFYAIIALRHFCKNLTEKDYRASPLFFFNYLKNAGKRKNDKCNLGQRGNKGNRGGDYLCPSLIFLIQIGFSGAEKVL